MVCKEIKNVLFIYFWFTCFRAHGFSEKYTQDMATTRVNTLSDDADDIQKQLDNEAKDRIKFGRPQTIWILHYPTKYLINSNNLQELGITESMALLQDHNSINKVNQIYHGTERRRKIFGKAFSLLSTTQKPKASWKYKDQVKWYLSYPSCRGSSQSPVDLPFSGLLRTQATRQMLFSMYNVKPKSMTLERLGETVFVTADWGPNRPFVYGGAAHSRRYVFHSLALRRPSEHTVGGLSYPLESQAIHVSAEYANLNHALEAADKDKSALLIVSNIYKHSNQSHQGLQELIQSMMRKSANTTLRPLALKVFSPPLKEYAAYHGSMTTPPCTENVLWLVRAKALPITRQLADYLETKSHNKMGQGYNRLVQPLHDRKIYYFN